MYTNRKLYENAGYVIREMVKGMEDIINYIEEVNDTSHLSDNRQWQ